ncbi:MAG TPA: branched-chain amino acid ABC transporter permease, partial [Micromonosporaceae bacterium]
MRTRITRLLPFAVLAVFVALPYSTLTVPGVFDGAVNLPGTLQLLALCCVFGGLAAGYDLLFGHTGLLSFGHALYFAAGVYGTDILITRAGFSLGLAVLVALLGGTLLAALLGAVALRTGGIAFAMVTLAFAQVGAILTARDPGGLTGGEEGLPLDASKLP